MSELTLSGKIIAVLQLKEGVSKSNGNPWATQSYVLETYDQYPKKVCFDIFGIDKIKSASIGVGEDVTISIDIDAHEYQGKWFNSIRAWKVDKQGQTPQAPNPRIEDIPGASDIPF